MATGLLGTRLKALNDVAPATDATAYSSMMKPISGLRLELPPLRSLYHGKGSCSLACPQETKTAHPSISTNLNTLMRFKSSTTVTHATSPLHRTNATPKRSAFAREANHVDSAYQFLLF
jgi:hypothetical protein